LTGSKKPTESKGSSGTGSAARFVFDNEHDFLEKLKSLVKDGAKADDIEIFAPHPVHKAEEVLGLKPSGVRVFTLVGCLTGAITGYLFPSFTVIDWPLISGNKPMISIPPFTIIAFELMVLFGALSAFLGFILMARMPDVITVVTDREFKDDFEIRVKNGGVS
jgi:hypothetical protein